MSTAVDQHKTSGTSQPPQVSLSEARKIVGELFTPKPWVYWTDFCVTWIVAMGAFSSVRQLELFSWQQVACFVISSLLFYRLAMFIHELVHLRSGTMNAFRFVWNLLVGIPFLMPSFVYYTHLDHHRRKHYGTEHDGEYLSLEHGGRWQIIAFLLSPLIVPPLAVFRFLVLTPLTWISPAVRDWVHRHASSMVIDPTYIRPLPTREALRNIRIQETLCFLWCLGIAIGAMTVGQWPYPMILHAYLTSVFILTINAVRTLGAHRWTNAEGEMTFLEQLLDTVNYPYRTWITALWGPVGTRYHALHHLFPSLPYHAMPEAHRRLERELPADHVYRQTTETSLIQAIAHLWQRATEAEQASATANHRANPAVSCAENETGAQTQTSR
ncbi:MAG: fatty acid desaturase [Pirellulaceae bacterium]